MIVVEIVIEIQVVIIIEMHVCNYHIIKVYRLKLELKISNYQIKFELELKYNSEIIRLDPLP